MARAIRPAVLFSCLRKSCFAGSAPPSLLVLAYAREEQLRVGQTVRLEGLGKAKAYNGRLGVVCNPMTQRGRYPVMMWRTRKVLGLCPENLVRTLGGGESMRVDVLVIGAGAAGLAAAQFLQDHKASVAVLEGRPRLGGRMLTMRLPAKTRAGDAKRSPQVAREECVDAGASYIHSCSDDNDIYKLALSAKPKPVVAVGAGNRWADTECARWFDEKTGEELSTQVSAKVHLLHWRISSNMTRIARNLGPEKASRTSLQAVFEQARDAMLERTEMKLDETEQRALNKIATRQWGYVSDPSRTASEVVRHFQQDNVDQNDMIASPMYTLQYGISLSARVAQTDGPKVGPIDAADGAGDRLLCSGYQDFLVNVLRKRLRCLTNKSVSRVQLPHETTGKRAGKKRPRPQVTVRCRDGTMYVADYLVCTVPLGVLKGNHGASSIAFEPPLDARKQKAIRELGMGIHNKIIVRFAPEDVFWPKMTPQLVPLDQRFQILNLHAYGKPGVLCAHVWMPFADGWDGKDDAGVVAEFLGVLRGMFWRNESKQMRDEPAPEPIDYVVARWDSDPFALGSYSYLKLGAQWQQITHLAAPFPEKNPRVFFAGEATTLEGIQSVTGAHKSGENAAKALLAAAAAARRGMRR